jgi:hypothetical protein
LINSKFCCIIGDYESLLVLLERPPVYCPSQSPRTIQLLVSFKRNEKDSILYDHTGAVVRPFTNKSQVLDIFGTPVLCDGGWNSPSNVEQLLTMVGNVHSARGQRGGYETSCQDCWDLENDGIHTHGCRVHRQGLRLWSQGNPCRSTIIELVTSKNNLHAATYTAHGDIAFTPEEFLDKRRTSLL